MFASICGGQPHIPVRLSNDDTTFNPKEYPNVVFRAKGKMSGKITLVHGGSETDESGLGLISIRVWVNRESDKANVVIKPSFDGKTFSLRLEAPDSFGTNGIYHETRIQLPRLATSLDSLFVEAPNTSFRGDGLRDLSFGSISSALSNGSIALEPVRTDVARLQTSNSSINCTFESAGHVDLHTSNGSITAKVVLRDALDGRQSAVSTKSSNAPLNIHVTATETVRGLWMENTTSNGHVVVGALIGRADRGSSIKTESTNSKIDFNVDASQSGQPLDVRTRTSNGSIVSSIMVPANHIFRGRSESSNAPVHVNLTEEFKGRFEVETRNAPAVIEGSEITLDHDNKYVKRGYRINDQPSEFRISTSNGSASLRFYPAGHSLAAVNDSEKQL